MESLSKGEKLADDIFAENYKQEQGKKRQRRLTYLIISWGLQALCALLVMLGLTWAVIQFMRIWGILGITSQEPPGLTYYIDFPDPPPPPPPDVL
jgi:hypothetical protein